MTQPQMIAILENAGIDLTNLSPTRAINSLMAKQLPLGVTNALIHQMAPTLQPVEDLKFAHIIAAYLIQDTLQTGRTVPYAAVDAAIITKAQQLRSNMWDGDETIETVDDDGNITFTRKVTESATPGRSRDGVSNQVKAQELFTSNPTLSRAEMIAKMVAELGIKPNTGSTYYAAFNKDVKRTTGGKKGKRAGATSREDQVMEVFNSKPEWSDRKALVAAIVEATGASTASANTFSYKVMPSSGTRAKKAPKVIKSNEPKTVASVLGAIGKKGKK